MSTQSSLNHLVRLMSVSCRCTYRRAFCTRAPTKRLHKQMGRHQTCAWLLLSRLHIAWGLSASAPMIFCGVPLVGHTPSNTTHCWLFLFSCRPCRSALWHHFWLFHHSWHCSHLPVLRIAARCASLNVFPPRIDRRISAICFAVWWTLWRFSAACCRAVSFFIFMDYLRDFLPAHFQRLRDRRNGLLGLRAAFGCFFI